MTSMPPVEFWHVVLAIFAYAIFGVAALQAAVLGLQLRLLRNQPSHRLLSILPPVEVMQTLMFRGIFLGFTALTLAIILGMVFYEQGGHVYLGKGGFTLFAWAVYAALLVAYYRLGLKIRLGILWAILAWVGLTLAYFGTKLIA